MGSFSIGGEHGQLDNDHSWWQPNSGKIQMNYMNERTDLALESLFPAKTAAKCAETYSKLLGPPNPKKSLCQTQNKYSH